MLYIDKDNTIHLTRGDTARISVPITNEQTGAEYEMSKNDNLILTIKKRETDPNVIVQKNIVGSNTFHIQPVDTKEMAFGKYVYDVQLTTELGDVYTVIAPSTFEILKEVTW